MKEITLTGGEISILKAAGLTGTPITGEDLKKKVSSLEDAEFVDCLQGLMMTGYLLAEPDSFQDVEEAKEVTFRVNSSYTRDLREAMSGRSRDKRQKRQRRG